jgi:hypothetical protein
LHDPIWCDVISLPDRPGVCVILQARVKIRWDDDYFYVGAMLHESYVTAQNVGHNNHAPYSPDNDFEIFIDVSGTSQYYVEYEMSAQNATYDIKWGKPDGTPLACDNTGASWPALPTCVNTSFRGYAGNWTMATKLHPGPMADRLNNFTKPALMNGSLTAGTRGSTAWPIAAEDTGMISATAWVGEDYERYTFPYSHWSAEIRFPIRQTPNYWTEGGGYPVSHGGLIDSDPMRQKDWNQYDPALGDAGPGRPRYWWVNFARAEHPRKYWLPDGTTQICPKNCTAEIEHALPNSTGASGAECKPTWPTILGGYWEWVWGPVGDAHPGVGYMHRPSSFPLVQFANETGETLCRNIEWPGRHVAKSIHLAQSAYAKDHNGVPPCPALLCSAVLVVPRSDLNDANSVLVVSLLCCPGHVSSLFLSPLTLHHTVVVTWRVYSYTHRHCMIRSGVM